MEKYLEKRSESRINYWTPITIEESGEESGVCFLYRARLANFSGRGLYFETDLLLQPGAKVYIGIQDLTHRFFPEDYSSFLVEIIWRKRLTAIAFNYGYGAKVIFDNAENKLQRNDHIELKELRKNTRKPFSKLTYFASGNKYYEGIIKNLSHGGAYIETKTKFSNGEELKLVVPGPNKYIQIRCKIIHFNQTGFGVKFKRVLKIEKLPEPKNSIKKLTM
jgi:Tfp pilus assembly protein PilZ